MEYNKKFFLDSQIQHLTQWDKFTPLSATKATSIESQKKSHIRSFQVPTLTHTLFTIFSFESRRTQASVSLECKSRLASRVIFAVGTLVTSVLKKKKNEDERRNEIPNDQIHENLHKHQLLLLYYSKATISKNRFVTHPRPTIIKIGISCQVTVVFQMSGVI